MQRLPSSLLLILVGCGFKASKLSKFRLNIDFSVDSIFLKSMPEKSQDKL